MFDALNRADRCRDQASECPASRRLGCCCIAAICA